MMRFSKCASIAAILLVFAASCGHPYKHLQSIPSGESALAYKPKIERELYRCVVDGRFIFKKFHLSGILLFKTFEDSSTRAVFQNEMGFAFFNFKWDARDSFSVTSILDQLNKPAVIKTLQRDIELVLMKRLSPKDEVHYLSAKDTLSRFPIGTGAAWYKLSDGQLRLIDYVGKSKITTIDLQGKAGKQELPVSIYIKHHKANFTIDLKKIISADEG
jgi:hypothetical protein